MNLLRQLLPSQEFVLLNAQTHPTKSLSFMGTLQLRSASSVSVDWMELSIDLHDVAALISLSLRDSAAVFIKSQPFLFPSLALLPWRSVLSSEPCHLPQSVYVLSPGKDYKLWPECIF